MKKITCLTLLLMCFGIVSNAQNISSEEQLELQKAANRELIFNSSNENNEGIAENLRDPIQMLLGDDGQMHAYYSNEPVVSNRSVLVTTLSTTYTGGNGGANGGAVYFDVTVGAQDIDVSSIDLSTNETGPFTVDIYGFIGTYVGNEADATPWGAALVTASGAAAPSGTPSTATLATPITLLANTTYAMALVLDATHGFDYTTGDGTNQQYSNSDLTIDLGSGSNAPFTGPTFNPRVWNGGITYDISGGGGAMACNQENPLSALAGGGMGSSLDSPFKTASDIVVISGENFTIATIDATFLTFAPSDPPITANIVYYEDAGGLPGVMIGSETVVPTILSAQPWANPIADQYETTMAVTPFTFAGDLVSNTTYWIEVSMGTATNQPTVFWEFTFDTPVVGNPAAQLDAVGAWSIPELFQETVYNFSGDCEAIFVPPLTNDICDEAINVACGDVVLGDTSDDTDSGGNAAPDEFYAFTGAGIPQDVTISLCDGGTTYDSFIRVFTDCTLATQIAGNDDSCGLQSELEFESDGTSTYYIMIEGFGNNAGAFSLAVTCASPVANDLCENAIEIGCDASVTGTTFAATVDNDVAGADCGTAITAPGVWYAFTDSSGLVGTASATLCNGTDFDSKISVFSGDCAALVCIDGNDDDCGLQSTIGFPTDGASTYYILVHGFAANTGNFTLDVTCMPTPPPNDMIANSIDVDEIGIPYTDPAVAMPAATLEAGNPADCSIDGSAGVWYNFVSFGDGTATATLTTPGGASAVIFYTAPDENAVETDLVYVDQFENQCAGGTTATISTIAGQAYYVFVVNSGAISDVVIDGTLLGANENTIEGFSFFPNPASSTLNITAQNTIDSVILFNLLGQEVLNQNVGAASSRLDVSSLSTGTYLMKVSVAGEIGTYKVIKQ